MKNVHYVGHPLLENKELVLSNIDYNENMILKIRYKFIFHINLY